MGSKKRGIYVFTVLYSSAADLGKQEKPDRFIIFMRYFRLQNVIFEKGPSIKKKSPCLGDSKHIFKLKIVQVFFKEKLVQKSAGFTILLAFCTVKCTQRPRWQEGRGAYYRDRYLARLALWPSPLVFTFCLACTMHRAHVATCNVISSPKTVAKERVNINSAHIEWCCFSPNSNLFMLIS
jgi:hypothetical protein